VSVWCGPGGIEIEVIVLNVAPLFKVTQTVNGRRYHLAYTATVDSLAQWVDLADLVEVIQHPAARRQTAPRA
jgi:hypothetical protein